VRAAPPARHARGNRAPHGGRSRPRARRNRRGRLAQSEPNRGRRPDFASVPRRRHLSSEKHRTTATTTSSSRFPRSTCLPSPRPPSALFKPSKLYSNPPVLERKSPSSLVGRKSLSFSHGAPNVYLRPETPPDRVFFVGRPRSSARPSPARLLSRSRRVFPGVPSLVCVPSTAYAASAGRPALARSGSTLPVRKGAPSGQPTEIGPSRATKTAVPRLRASGLRAPASTCRPAALRKRPQPAPAPRAGPSSARGGAPLNRQIGDVSRNIRCCPRGRLTKGEIEPAQGRRRPGWPNDAPSASRPPSIRVS